MNLYARLSSVKADLKLSLTGNDDVLVRLIEDVSRAVDDLTHRRFYSEIATRYFDGDGRHSVWVDDIVTITTLKVDQDGDGAYEMELAANTDYWLYPDNDSPKQRIDLNPQSPQLTSFPDRRRAIEIAGVFGYSDETELTGATVSDDPLTAGATTINVDDGTLVDVGETLVLESEQVYVSAIATNALTVVRGINGTTAASHAASTAVERRRYERPIERAVTMQVSRFFRGQQTGESGEVGRTDVGGFTVSTLYPAIRDMLEQYKILVAA